MTPHAWSLRMTTGTGLGQYGIYKIQLCYYSGKDDQAGCLSFLNACILFSFLLEMRSDTYSHNNHLASMKQDESNSQLSKVGRAQRTNLHPCQQNSAAAPTLSHLSTDLSRLKIKTLLIVQPTVSWVFYYLCANALLTDKPFPNAGQWWSHCPRLKCPKEKRYVARKTFKAEK